jgi:hypothetical protein
VTAKSATGRVLTAPAMNTHNTFAAPTAVQPAAFTGAKLSGQTLTVALPSKSVVVLELNDEAAPSLAQVGGRVPAPAWSEVARLSPAGSEHDVMAVYDRRCRLHRKIRTPATALSFNAA